MAKKSIKVVGQRELDREIDQLRKKLGIKGGEFADYAANAVRDGVVRNVQPFGKGKKAQEKGINAVRGDLLKCFRVVKDAEARRPAVITGFAEAAQWHQRRRNSRGRVKRGERKAITSSTFSEYFDKIAGRVGMAKASVAAGGDSRLKSRLPKWIRPWLKTGDGSRKKKQGGATWTFSAEPEAVASDRVLGSRGVQRVMRMQKRLVRNYLRRDMRRELKRRERKVNR